MTNFELAVVRLCTDDVIKNRDKVIATLAEKIMNPKSKMLQVVAKVVRFFEVKDVKRVAETLEG